MQARRPQPRSVVDAPAFLRDRLGFLERAAAAADGRAARVRLGTPTFLLTDPDDIEHVLWRNEASYGKTRRLTGPRALRVFGRGILTSAGDEHIDKRRTFASSFARKSAPLFAPAIQRSVAETLERWTPGREIELGAEMSSLARRAVLRMLFGVGAPEVDELDAEIMARQRFLDYSIVSLSPRPEWMPRRVVREHRASARRLDAAIAAAIRARRAEPTDDLVSRLCQARHQDGPPVSDTEVRDEIIVLTITGYETLGAGLAWTLYLLATHPEVERELLAELDGQEVDPARIGALVTTEQVILESLRLYPPTWIVVRMALENDRLPSGQRVHAGDKLYTCQWVTHRDPRFFVEPARFEPSRFAPERRGEWPEAAYFPFGAGRHLCLGKHMVMTELALAITGILLAQRLAVVPGQRIEPRPGLVLAPRYGIRAVVSPR